MTKTILQLRSKVIQAQKKAFKTQSIETFSDFKRLRSKYQRELRQAKVKYYGRVIERAGTNTKKTMGYCKQNNWQTTKGIKWYFGN